MKRLFLLFALFAFPASLHGQLSTGTITGVVTDTSGGSIPEADVRIVNRDTGAVRSLTTQISGAYVARNLPLGNYEVEAGYTGFQPETKTGIVVTIDQTLTLNFTLQPGGQQEVVTLVARSEQLVEAATSSLGQAIEDTEIRNLPLNGRNYRQLIALPAGAVPVVQGVFTSGNYYMSGGRGDANAFLLDGLDIRQFSTGGPLTSINLEAVGEFKVITNSYSAEYGRTLSGVVTASIKGGTNEFHGSLLSSFATSILMHGTSLRTTSQSITSISSVRPLAALSSRTGSSYLGTTKGPAFAPAGQESSGFRLPRCGAGTLQGIRHRFTIT